MFEDAHGALSMMEEFLNWLFATPWWVPSILTLVFAAIFVWFLLRDSRSQSQIDEPDPGAAEPPEKSEPEPQPDERIPYLAIQNLANERGWQIVDRSSQSANRAYMLEGHLRQAAVDGDLHVWGRKSSEPVANTPLLPIPASHFEEFEFENGPWVYPMENRHTRTGQLGVPRESLVGQSYVDLHVSKNDVVRLLDRLEAPVGTVV